MALKKLVVSAVIYAAVGTKGPSAERSFGMLSKLCLISGLAQSGGVSTTALATTGPMNSSGFFGARQMPTGNLRGQPTANDRLLWSTPFTYPDSEIESIPQTPLRVPATTTVEQDSTWVLREIERLQEENKMLERDIGLLDREKRFLQAEGKTDDAERVQKNIDGKRLMVDRNDRMIAILETPLADLGPTSTTEPASVTKSPLQPASYHASVTKSPLQPASYPASIPQIPLGPAATTSIPIEQDETTLEGDIAMLDEEEQRLQGRPPPGIEIYKRYEGQIPPPAVSIGGSTGKDYEKICQRECHVKKCSYYTKETSHGIQFCRVYAEKFDEAKLLRQENAETFVRFRAIPLEGELYAIYEGQIPPPTVSIGGSTGKDYERICQRECHVRKCCYYTKETSHGIQFCRVYAEKFDEAKLLRQENAETFVRV